MVSTGNIQNYLRKLQTELRFIKIRDIDYKSLQIGNPCEFLKIYHYIFLDYNPLFAKTLLDKCKCDFYGKTDNHFIDAMYKTLRDYFNYKPPITKEQFFTTNFAERKLQMAYDIVILVRKECKNINQSKKSGSSSARVTNVDKEKKRISSNVFHPLHDMGLETTVIDEFVSMERQHPDESLILPDDQTKLKTTINHLEEQIEILKVKIEDINERLNNITLILQDTHLENNSITSSDIINFNARLIIVENELSILRKKSSQNNNNNNQINICQTKQSIIPQGILIESDDDGTNLPC